MSEKVFDAYYEKNGISATDEKDIATYFYDNYGRFQIIQVSLKEGNGDKITPDEGKKAKKEQAQGYVDRLLAGEDYDKVYHEYQDLVAKEKAEAEAESNSGNSSAVSSAASSAASSSRSNAFKKAVPFSVFACNSKSLSVIQQVTSPPAGADASMPNAEQKQVSVGRLQAMVIIKPCFLLSA